MRCIFQGLLAVLLPGKLALLIAALLSCLAQGFFTGSVDKSELDSKLLRGSSKLAVRFRSTPITSGDILGGYPRPAQGPCPQSTYSVAINDRSPGTFVLPRSAHGKVEERPCVFKGESYKEGVMRFKCKDAGWYFTDHTCKGRANVADQCEFTTHTYTLYNRPGQFLLPLSNPGTVEERPCVFKGESYSQGSVRFVCADGKWRQDACTCSQPVSGRCPQTGYTFKLSGHKTVHKLPSGDNGATEERPCVFQGKTYVQGAVKFTCEDGAWKFLRHTCSDVPVGGCGATKFKLRVGKNEVRFNLPNIGNGAKKQWPCKFESKTYAEGVIKFACADGRWKFINHTCTDQVDKEPSV